MQGLKKDGSQKDFENDSYYEEWELRVDQPEVVQLHQRGTYSGAAVPPVRSFPRAQTIPRALSATYIAEGTGPKAGLPVTAEPFVAEGSQMRLLPRAAAVVTPLPNNVAEARPGLQLVTSPQVKVPPPPPGAETRAPTGVIAKRAVTVEEEGPVVKTQWEEYEQLGLVPPPKPKPGLQQKSAKVLVSTYRLLGFSILTIIVVILVGYIATSTFYYLNKSWVQPLVVSPTDQEVLQLESQVASASNERDRLAAELSFIDDFIVEQQKFQGEFGKAIKSDLSDRKASLGRLRTLANEYAGARAQVRGTNSSFAATSKDQMQQEYAAGLIDRTTMASGEYQLAQIASSNLSLAERQLEYESKAQELESQTRSLSALLSKRGKTSALSYDVLQIKRAYDVSQLETSKALSTRKALVASIGRQDKILEKLSGSPQLRAANSEAHVAFVPYDNFDRVSQGAKVFRCRLNMVICREVGTIAEILPSEVTFKHPQRDRVLRGRMVELQLTENDAAEDDILFIGRKPLFF